MLALPVIASVYVLPRLSLHDAQVAATLLEHAVRPLAYRMPPVDLCHPAAAGLPVLVALAAKWRDGVPYLLTEHGVYLRERYLEYGGMPVAVKAVMLRFYRALARITTVVPVRYAWPGLRGA